MVELSSAMLQSIINIEEMMNLIKQLLTEEAILLDVNVADKEGLFVFVGQLLGQRYLIPTAEIIELLTARERLGSTGLGKELAIPHARFKGIHQPVAALIRLRNPIEFDAPDGELVHIFFVMLAPEQATEQHLQLLSNAAEILANPQFREQFELASTSKAVFNLIQQWEPRDY